MGRFTPYHEESVKFAKQLTEGIQDPLERFYTISKWVTKHIMYDYIKAITVPKKGKEVPDLERTWKKKRGICLDIASLTTGMMRAVGLKAELIFGYADGRYHAWVEATICGKRYRYDHDGKAKNYVRKEVY